MWYSVCNLLAGLSPTFTFLFVTRALLGIGMGAEWPAGAALAMESWPARSRGLMSGVLQGSWGWALPCPGWRTAFCSLRSKLGIKAMAGVVCLSSAYCRL